MNRATRVGRAVVLLAVTILLMGAEGCAPDVPTPVPPPTSPPPTPSPTPSPDPEPSPPDPPQPSPPDPQPEPPAPRPRPTSVIATQFGLGQVTVGASVADVERALGIHLEEQSSSRGACTVRLDPHVGIATIDNDGSVQTFVVLTPELRTSAGVGVGSRYEDIVAAYPQWVAGLSGYTTRYGGRFVPVEISPYAQRADYTATGRHLMFELDADDVVRRYRVGAPPYVFHTEVCFTPE